MMWRKYQEPGNDLAKLAALKAALSSAKSDRAKSLEYVLEETFGTLKTFVPEFEEKVTTIQKKLSARSKEIEERNSSCDLLSRYTLDGFEVVRRLAHRENMPAHVLQLYGLPLDGTNPQPASAAEWIAVAKTFVEGAKEVEAQGFSVVSCPSPAEIEKFMKKAEREYNDVAGADRSYDMEQADIAEMRKGAENLIADVMDELRLTLRKMDMPSQRRVQRSYGAKFKYLKGEEVDPDDTEPIIDEGTGVQAS